MNILKYIINIIVKIISDFYLWLRVIWLILLIQVNWKIALWVFLRFWANNWDQITIKELRKKFKKNKNK